MRLPSYPSGWRRIVSHLKYYGVLLLVVLAAYWPFRETLGYYFTKAETTSNLLWPPRASLDLITALLLDDFSLANLPAFVSEGTYYRPVRNLSFFLDYALWGWNPMGYHLTDLILHVAAAGLLFRLVYLVNDRDLWSAGAAGFLFTLHPVMVHIVPANVHREESIAAVFLLGGLLAFRRCEVEGGSVVWRGVALASFLMATGSREVGIIFLPIVLGYLYLAAPPRPTRLGRVSWTVRRGGAYLLTALVYVGWWLYVTEAMAFRGSPGLRSSQLDGSLWKTLLGFPLRIPRNLPGYLGSLFFPFRHLYGSIGAWLPKVGSVYLDPLLGIRLVWGAGTLLLLGLFLWWLGRRASDSLSTGIRGSLAFYTLWLLIAAGFFALVQKTGLQYAYHGWFPVSALGGTLLVASLRSVRDRVWRSGTAPGFQTGPGVWTAAGVAVLLTVHAGVLLGVSPLLKDYPAWRHSQSVNRVYYESLFRQLSRLPPGSTVHLEGIPRWVGKEEPYPHFGFVEPLLTPQPFISARFPDHQFNVGRRKGRLFRDPCPCPLWIEKRQHGSHVFTFVTHRFDGSAKGTP